jgi:hypothetical protein
MGVLKPITICVDQLQLPAVHRNLTRTCPPPPPAGASPWSDAPVQGVPARRSSPGGDARSQQATSRCVLREGVCVGGWVRTGERGYRSLDGAMRSPQLPSLQPPHQWHCPCICCPREPSPDTPRTAPRLTSPGATCRPPSPVSCPPKAASLGGCC